MNPMMSDECRVMSVEAQGSALGAPLRARRQHSGTHHSSLITHHFRRAFSLLEVVIAMTILAMITGTLFTIIRGSVKGAADIEKLQRENDQVNRFMELCRVTFQTLPISATLSLKMLDSTAAGGQELTIAGTPTCFGFGMNPISYVDSILGVQPDTAKPTSEDGKPRVIVSVSRKDIIPQTTDTTLQIQQGADAGNTADDQGRYWMPLLPGVTALAWKFFKDDGDEWLDEWTSTALPDLIEMNLTMDGRATPIRMVFAPPAQTLQPASAETKPKDAKVATTPNTNTSTSDGGGGRGGRGDGGKGGDNGGKGGGDAGRGGRGDNGGGPRGGDGGGGPRGGGGPGGPGGGPGGPGGGPGGPGGPGGGGR